MNLILSKTPQNDIKFHVLPMIYRALEVPVASAQVKLSPCVMYWSNCKQVVMLEQKELMGLFPSYRYVYSSDTSLH